MSVTVGADGSKMSTTDIGMAGNATITALAAAATKVTSSSDAATALTTVKTAISTFSWLQSRRWCKYVSFGGRKLRSCRLMDNLASAKSRISDVDVATESANFARQQILVQSDCRDVGPRLCLDR